MSIVSRLGRMRHKYKSALDGSRLAAELLALEHLRQRSAQLTNPLNRCGAKVFSQSDEDGIIQEIMRRLGKARPTYCEYGVGDGRECNTLALAAQGSRGFWIGGEALAFDTASIDPGFFRFDRQWVNHDNVVALYRKNCAALGIAGVDLLSFDLDSNDLFFVAALLAADVRPSLFIVEYNAKFTPPILWSTRGEDDLVWSGTDYMGASLQSFVNLLGKYGYQLVCCNAATGANAFFVSEAELVGFADIPAAVDELYMTPSYIVAPVHGHPSDVRTIKRLMEIGAMIARGVADPEFAAAGLSPAVAAGAE